MNKSKPEYKLVIYSNEATVTVTNPITCQFTVTRGLLSDNNKATIKLYNLAPNTRDKIFQDAYTIDWEKFKYVQLYAGYNGNVPLIFKGRILQAYSYKNGGDTDIITDKLVDKSGVNVVNDRMAEGSVSILIPGDDWDEHFLAFLESFISIKGNILISTGG